ncbi:uncharacterized protein LOC144746038 [Ciona intestinalis]
MSNISEELNVTNVAEYERQKVGSLVVSILTACVGAYVFFALLTHEIIVCKKKPKKRTGPKRVTREDLMRRLCLVASFLLLFRMIAEFIEIGYGETSHNVCRYVRAFKSVVHSLVVTCIYLVLWIRQRRFYKTPALEYLSTPFVRTLSFSVVIIMAVTNVSNIGLYLITRAYTNSPRGCVVEWSSIAKLTPGLVLVVSTLTFQLVLLGLLIYPLFHHLKYKKQRGLSGACSGPSNEIPYIKRVTVAAMVAVITDIICGAVTVFALKNTYGSMRQVVYDIDMLILLIAICMSFENWRNRLLPFCSLSTNSRSSSRSSTCNSTSATPRHAGSQNTSIATIS